MRLDGCAQELARGVAVMAAMRDRDEEAMFAAIPPDELGMTMAGVILLCDELVGMLVHLLNNPRPAIEIDREIFLQRLGHFLAMLAEDGEL